MIKGLGVENFKAFKEFNKIDFKKINVLLGPNSSGKSSYLKALITIANTIKSKESEPAIHLNDSIGGFKSIVHGKNSNNIGFSLTLSDSITVETIEEELFKDSVTDKGAIFIHAVIRLIKDHTNFDVNIYKEFLKNQYKEYRKNPARKIEFTIKETAQKPNIINSFRIELLNGDKVNIFMKRNSYYIKYNNMEFREPNLIEPNKFYFKFNHQKVAGISTEDMDTMLKIAFALKEVEHNLTMFVRNFIHIEPFRNEPKRTELVTNFKFNSVGPKGENTLSTVIGLKDDTEKIKSKTSIKNEINRWLNEFDLAQSIDVEELKSNTYSLVIKNKFTGHVCNIVDVGVGTSQLLPIIIESVISPNGSILLIEEPETHIHPNAQAKLAELFANCSNQFNSQFFIETHSMYLVRQLQILVAQKVLNPDDIGIYYFEQDEDGSHIKNMRLFENGQFTEEFPKGFFDVPFELTKTFMNYI